LNSFNYPLSIGAATPSSTTVDNDLLDIKAGVKIPKFQARSDHRLISALIIAIVFLISAFYFALIGPARIPSTYETSVCLNSLFMVCLLCCGLLANMGRTILITDANRHTTFLEYSFAIALLTPMLGLPNII